MNSKVLDKWKNNVFFSFSAFNLIQLQDEENRMLQGEPQTISYKNEKKIETNYVNFTWKYTHMEFLT